MEPPGEDIALRTLEPLIEGRDPDPRASQPESPSLQSIECANCQAELQGPFCNQCGQRTGGLDVTLGQFAREAFDNLFSFDSRLWSTLRPLVTKPGFLTVEYWRGRRARYMPPLRMYLFVSFLTFLVMGALHTVRPEVGLPMVRASGDLNPNQSDDASSAQSGRSEPLVAGETDWEEQARGKSAPMRYLLLDVLRPAVEEPDQTRKAFVRRLPWAVFCLVPVMALLLRLAYRRKHPYFVPHLIFSLHFHTLAFVLMTVGFLYQMIVGRDHLDSPINLWIAIAFFLGLRRAYGEGKVRTLVKLLFLASGYLFALVFAMAVSFLLTGLAN